MKNFAIAFKMGVREKYVESLEAVYGGKYIATYTDKKSQAVKFKKKKDAADKLKKINNPFDRRLFPVAIEDEIEEQLGVPVARRLYYEKEKLA